jgi:hypothetical protein
LGAPQHRLLRHGENTWQRKAGKQNKTSETNFPRNLALNHAGRAAVAGASPFGTATGANPFQSKVRSEQHSQAELFAGFGDNDSTSVACLIRDIPSNPQLFATFPRNLATAFAHYLCDRRTNQQNQNERKQL